MSWVDLSQPVHGGMPVYPGDDPVVISQDKFLSRDHYNHFVSCHGQHVGTHVDGPMHMTDSPATIDAFPPEQFCGDAVLFDVRGLGEVAVADIDATRLFPGCVALFLTGWALQYGTQAYYASHPALSPELADCLVAAGVKLVGVDMPSPDHVPFPVHRRLLSAGVCIVENLRGLDRLLHKAAIRFYAFPLAIRADSSPVRAVAEVD